MKLAELNGSSQSLTLLLDGLATPEQLTNLAFQLRDQTRDRPNGLIDEALVGNMLHGLVLNLRGALAGIPKGLLTDPTKLPNGQTRGQALSRLLQFGTHSPYSLFDPRLDNWWQELSTVLMPTRPGTNKPAISPSGFAQHLKQTVKQQAGGWLATTQRRQQQADQTAANRRADRTELAGLRDTLRKQLAVKRLLARYGVNLPLLANQQQDVTALKKARAAGLPPKQAQASAAIMLQVLQYLASQEGQQILKQLQATKTATEGTARALLRALAGPQPLAETAWLGNMVDLLSPERRAAIGQGYVHRTQNKMVASLALAAAWKLSRYLAAQARREYNALPTAQVVHDRPDLTDAEVSGWGRADRKPQPNGLPTVELVGDDTEIRKKKPFKLSNLHTRTLPRLRPRSVPSSERSVDEIWGNPLR